MRSTLSVRFISFFAFVAAGYILWGTPVIAQEKIKEKDKSYAKHYKEKAFCAGDHWSNGDKVSYKEAREATIPASGSVNVDSGRNGGISVKGENRSDILVRACVNGWAATDEAARALVAGVRIDTAGGTIKADSANEENWSVSFEVLVPRNTNLNLRAHNGGIAIKSVEGTIEFETTNGGVSVSDLAGSVKGRTTNGGVNVALTGNGWKGSGMEVVTTNGGVNLTVPETYAANFETGTTNGGFKSDVPSLNVEQEDNVGKTDHWQRSKRVRASMNGGGANIRVVTTNGGIRIGSSGREL
jgi:hypothetical protein